MYRQYKVEVDENMPLVEAVQNNQTIISNVIEQLDNLSYLFHRMGNEKIGKEISDLISPLQYTAKQVSKSYDSKLTEDLNRSSEMTASLLRLSLELPTIAKKINNNS